MVTRSLPWAIYGFVGIVVFLCNTPIAQIPLNVQQPYGNNLGLVPFYNASGYSPFQNQQQQAFMQQGGFYADRRMLDGYWVLYPFGEQQFDERISEQPNHDTQIDLDFYYPYYGFRFNYTFILPNGLIAFSLPEWIQPPYEFPNPKWPERRDASFIAPFFADADFQYVADLRISSVWYRTVHRPRTDLINAEGFYQNPENPQPAPQQPFYGQGQEQQANTIRRQVGYVEDSALLDNITSDIQYGVNGANGFRALHALIVTWERMAYGGAPKEVDPANFEEAKKWQNTYQLVLATDEIRSYAIFNYAYVNWTSSSEAGSRGRGRGGYQSAIAGFNGGNGTGFTPMPYSGEGEIYKLARFSSVSFPGRWMYRVDEEIIFGGCSNASAGYMTVAPDRATMLGGLAVNVSGPCFRAADNVVVLFDEFLISCRKFNMHRAMCMLPKFHKVGMINTRISRDGGASFPYIGNFYIVPPDRAIPGVVLRRDVYDYTGNAFDNYEPNELTITWSRVNLTGDPNARVNIEVWGYWEDTERHVFEKVGLIAEGTANTGNYTFNPRLLMRPLDPALQDKWRTYEVGVVRVSITDDEAAGVLYSMATPLAFYFKPYWQEHYGDEWALHRCVEWFEMDGRWRNYWMDIEACPCNLDQALLDIGRFMPFLECDKDGDGGCYYHRGAQHCIMSIHSTWTGAQTICCYDFDGWLMHSDDYEGLDVLKYYSPGIPYRAHTYGSYPYKVPPYIPTFSNWMHDLGPYHMCCRWAMHCEFLFWRRSTHGCQGYFPPAAGYSYGNSHFVTFDGVKYTFSGKGYYVLAMSDHPWNKLMIQVRMEQPARNPYGTVPNVTVITGVAVRENDSDVVEVLARKEFRSWRYRMDVMVKGIPRFFDTPDLKVQQFRGFHLWSPSRNFDQSVIHVQMRSGVGVRVQEFNGILDIMVTLPQSYNMTHKKRGYYNDQGQYIDEQYSVGRVQDFYRTYGLLGLYNGDPNDDLMPLDGTSPVRTTNMVGYDPAMRRSVYYDFGQKWRIDGSNRFIGPLLFQTNIKPIYNPQLFADAYYEPSFNELRVPLNATLILNDRQVIDACQAHFPCQHDFIATGRRELGQSTLRKENEFVDLRDKGSIQLMSCGAIYKAYGVRKSPPGNNYLEGVTVTMDCRPEFFMHGTAQRTCVNGLWTPGWHVWCRLRTEENILKWATGVCATVLFIAFNGAIFGCCYYRNIKPTGRQASLSKTSMYRKLSTTLLGSKHPSVLPPPHAQRALLPPPPRGEPPKIREMTDSENSSPSSTPVPQMANLRASRQYLEHVADDDRMSTKMSEAEYNATTGLGPKFTRLASYLSRSGNLSSSAANSPSNSRRPSYVAAGPAASAGPSGAGPSGVAVDRTAENRINPFDVIRELEREPSGRPKKSSRSVSSIVVPMGMFTRQQSPLANAPLRHIEESSLSVLAAPKTTRSVSVASPPRIPAWAKSMDEDAIRSPYPDFSPPEGIPPLFEMTRGSRKSSLPMYREEDRRGEVEDDHYHHHHRPSTTQKSPVQIKVMSPVSTTIEETAEEEEVEDDSSSADAGQEQIESSDSGGNRASKRRIAYAAASSRRDEKSIPLVEFDREPGSKTRMESDV